MIRAICLSPVFLALLMLSSCAWLSQPTPTGTLHYYKDADTGKCFAVIFRDNGHGIAMAEVNCDDIPEDVLLEATRE